MFEGWDNYFIMVGSASAGLIGLLFVVITLTSGFDRNNALRGQALYMTPTMVNFSVVLATSAVSVIPKLPPAGFAALAGLGLVLGLLNAARASLGIAVPRPGLPTPHWSDFWMYGATPALMYLLGLSFCAMILMGVVWAGPAVAGLLLVVLLVGIRNAWDLVTWIAPMGGVDPTVAAATPPTSQPPTQTVVAGR